MQTIEVPMLESGNTTHAEEERQQNEVTIVASLSRGAVQVTPVIDRVDTLSVVSMVALPDELLQHIFKQACNVLEPRLALSSASHGLWAATQEGRKQLRADHEAAAALCLKMGLRSCKELREAKVVYWHDKGLSAADLTLLGTLGSVLPALEELSLNQSPGAAGPDGVQRLAEGLGAGALPAVTALVIHGMHVGDAGALALAAALGQGALPQLKILTLSTTAIGDAGLVALAPALRRLPALGKLSLGGNPFGDEGLAALVAPLPPASTPPPPPAGVLTKLKQLKLSRTLVTDTGCAALAAALDSGALPALEELYLGGTPASAAARATVYAARETLKGPQG
eukprot:scaffold68867_cov63-Phaeocystis_antarctica.AAC.2